MADSFEEIWTEAKGLDSFPEAVKRVKHLARRAIGGKVVHNGPGSDISRAIQGRQVVGLQGNGETQASKRAPLLDTALGKERVNNNTVLTEQQKSRMSYVPWLWASAS